MSSLISEDYPYDEELPSLVVHQPQGSELKRSPPEPMQLSPPHFISRTPSAAVPEFQTMDSMQAVARAPIATMRILSPKLSRFAVADTDELEVGPPSHQASPRPSLSQSRSSLSLASSHHTGTTPTSLLATVSSSSNSPSQAQVSMHAVNIPCQINQMNATTPSTVKGGTSFPTPTASAHSHDEGHVESEEADYYDDDDLDDDDDDDVPGGDTYFSYPSLDEVAVPAEVLIKSCDPREDDYAKLSHGQSHQVSWQQPRPRPLPMAHLTEPTVWWLPGGLKVQRIGPPIYQIFRWSVPAPFLSLLAQVKVACDRHALSLPSGWKTHFYSLTKQDIALADVPGCLALTHPISDLVCRVVESMYGHAIALDRNQPHVLRYDQQHDSVPLHYDRCHVTVNLMMSPTSDYSGGGTFVDALQDRVMLEQGDVLMHPGSLLHGGCPIQSGTRYLLVYFCDFVQPYDYNDDEDSYTTFARR